MRLAVVAEIVQNLRRALCDFGADRAFAIQDAHGVALQAALACFAELVLVLREIRLERLVELCAAGWAADGIDLQAQVLDSQAVKHALRQADDLGVRVLQQGAHNARRPLRPEGDRAPALILEGVHLLLHNVGGFPYGTLEQARILKDGRADLPEAVQGGLAAHHILHHLPIFTLARQDVLGSLLCLNQFHLIASYRSVRFSGGIKRKPPSQ